MADYYTDDVEEDFYDDEEDYDEDEYYDEYYDEYEDDIEEDDEETFEPDEEVGGDAEVSTEQYDDPFIPELLTDISGYVGTVSIVETGNAKVDVILDFKDLAGISTYEVRVTPI